MTIPVFVDGMHIDDDGNIVIDANELDAVGVGTIELVKVEDRSLLERLSIGGVEEREAAAEIATLTAQLKAAQDTIASLREADERAVKIAAEEVGRVKDEYKARLKEAEKEVATLKVQLSEEYRDWMKEQCNEECRYGERLFAEVKAENARLRELITEHDGIECAKHDVLVRTAVADAGPRSLHRSIHNQIVGA